MAEHAISKLDLSIDGLHLGPVRFKSVRNSRRLRSGQYLLECGNTTLRLQDGLIVGISGSNLTVKNFHTFVRGERLSSLEAALGQPGKPVYQQHLYSALMELPDHSVVYRKLDLSLSVKKDGTLFGGFYLGDWDHIANDVVIELSVSEMVDPGKSQTSP